MGSPRVPAFFGQWWIAPSSRLFILGAALGVGAVSFLAAGLMHHMVPDTGRHRERLLAEGSSVYIASCLIRKLADLNRRQRRLTVACDAGDCRSESSHPKRSDLLSLSAYLTENQQVIRLISEGVERIDWALRQIMSPKFRYAKRSGTVSAIFKHEGAHTNECRKSSLR